MYIVKNIVEVQGDTIWLESQERQGTSVFVALPANYARLPNATYNWDGGEQ